VAQATDSCRLPCAVQIGFAGSRQLLDPQLLPAAEAARQEAEVADYLARRLASLPQDLELGEHHFFCAISQIGIGADTAFTRACQERGIPQRIFLPEHEDAYLVATGSDGKPDLPKAAQAITRKLLDGSHVIERRLVSDAPDRRARFEDTNRAIAAASDLVVCLLPEEAEPGSTVELLELARAQGIPALEIRMSPGEQGPGFHEVWHDLDQFSSPALPPTMDALQAPEMCTEPPRLPTIQQLASVVEGHFSRMAARQRKSFERAARLIIGTHVLATVLVALVLAAQMGPPDAEEHGAHTWPLVVLGLELAALALGFTTHLWRRHTRPAREWALARLTAEINRSVLSLGHWHMPLHYLFRLHLPWEHDLLPLLRTLDILHLWSTREYRDPPSGELCERYVVQRLTDGERGEVHSYRERCKKEKCRGEMAHAMFATCSFLAIGATLVELLLLAELIAPPEALESMAPGGLGFLAIVLPVLAVGALSWAAAQDYEGKVHRYAQMSAFLDAQVKALQAADSTRERQRLVQETELQLLRETAQWYSRRAWAPADLTGQGSRGISLTPAGTPPASTSVTVPGSWLAATRSEDTADGG